MKKYLFTTICLLSQFILFAQLDTAKLNQLFATYDKHNKAMLSMCIYDKGNIIYDNAIGFSNLEKKEKANVYTQYHIGSISKMFTAVMIFQLIDEKKLSLDTKLSTFFPTLPNSKKITISNLLNHRSGLFNFTTDDQFENIMTKAMTENELIKLFEKQKPEFEPDTKADYSNTNYVVLSFIVERITKNTYNKELIKRICAKIPLGDTKIGLDNREESNVAKSYDYETDKWIKSTETHSSIPRGAGAIISTARDLSMFIEALFDGKLMSKTSFDKMKEMQDGYGRGIFQFPFGNKKSYGHNGAIDGFRSMLAHFQEDGYTISILSNGLNYKMNNITLAVLNILYNKPFSIPTFEKKVLDEASKKIIPGVYGNDKIGMKITVKQQGDQLTAQATGQDAFPLTKVTELEYTFEQAGVRMLFDKNTEGNILSFKLFQGGNELVFAKEE